jgi:YVTN family beta-propeller protein
LLVGLLGAFLLLAPQAALARTAYVPNHGDKTVTPINTATNTAGAAIAVGLSPFAVAITPDGRTAYVANQGGKTVTRIDTRTNKAVAAIAVGNTPSGVAITPDGGTAYVANQGDGTVTPINTATNTPGTTIASGSGSASGPFAVAITPDGRTAYVTNSGDGTVTPINTATNKPGTAIPLAVGSKPDAVAITPDGRTAYVTNDIIAGTVTPINTATNKPGAPIAVGRQPDGVAITPDGRTAYVTNFGGGTVTPINTATNTAGATIAVGSNPFGVAITPDGRTAYVTNDLGAGTVTPINTATKTPGATIPVGSNPFAVAVTPDQSPSAVFGASSVTLGQATSFDGSASADSDGSVVAYAWSFGDGSTLATASPQTSHAYARPGVYTATLTVTDNEGCSRAFVFTGQTASCHGSAGASTSRRVTVTAHVPPSARISSPGGHQRFSLHRSVRTSFSCAEGAGGPGLASCTDSNGASSPHGRLRTNSTGSHRYTITALSKDGQRVTARISYTVIGSPTATKITLTGLTDANPRLRFKLHAGVSAPPLRSFTVSLPAGLRFNHNHKQLATGLSASGAGKYALSVSHGKLTVRLKKPANAASITIGGPTLIETKSLVKHVAQTVKFNHRHRHKKPKKHKLLTLRVRVRANDTAHTATGLVLTVKIS